MNTTSDRTKKLSINALQQIIIRNLKAKNNITAISSNLLNQCAKYCKQANESYQMILSGLQAPMNLYFITDFYLDLYSRATENGYENKEAADYAALFRILSGAADYDEAITTVSRLYTSEPLVQALTSNTAHWMPVRYEGVNKDSGYADEFCSWTLIQDKRILAHERKYYVYKKDYTNLKAKEIIKWN